VSIPRIIDFSYANLPTIGINYAKINVKTPGWQIISGFFGPFNNYDPSRIDDILPAKAADAGIDTIEVNMGHLDITRIVMNKTECRAMDIGPAAQAAAESPCKSGLAAAEFAIEGKHIIWL